MATADPRSAPRRDPAAVRRLRRTGLAASASAGLIGAALLVARIAGVAPPHGADQVVDAAPVTGLAVALAAAALLLWWVRRRGARQLRTLAVVGAAALAAVRLLELVTDGDLGLERLLGRLHPVLESAGAPMRPATAATLLLAAAAILALEVPRRPGRVAAQALAVALAPVPLLAVVGHAYRVSPFYESMPATAMGLPTAVALLLLALGILLARPEEGFVANLATAGSGSAMARRMLLYALALPPALGWLALAAGEPRAGSGAFAVALVVVALTLVLVLLVLRDAAALDRMEVAKERAQAERERSREALARALGREREARAHAEAASRAKDEFLTTLSHELRTPLNAILGWTRLLRDAPADAERVRRGLAVLERNGRALAQVVADLLDMSRIARGVIQLERTEVDLVSAVEAAVEALRPAAQAKGVRLSRAVRDGVPRVLGDPARLQQIAWNLLSNAVKFTPAGGRVDVVLSAEEGRAVLTVEDSGAGIAPEFLPHLFERFRQADGSAARRHGGLGLGLALTRELVSLHGGTVEAVSAGEGRGATFCVALPAAAAPLEATPPAPAWPPRGRLGAARILVVDDEVDSRELLLQLLESWGARAAAAGSAREALEALGREAPDVLVSDIAMPGEDGFALVQAVRAGERERGARPLPAVALTAFARPEDRRRALEAGFDAHVAKPVVPEELLGTLSTLLRSAALAAPGPPLGAVELAGDGDDPFPEITVVEEPLFAALDPAPAAQALRGPPQGAGDPRSGPDRPRGGDGAAAAG